MLLICSWDCCNRFLAITAAALDNKALFVFTSSFNSSRFSCCSVCKNIVFQASTSWSVSLTSATSASAFFKQIAACSWRHTPSTAFQTDHHHLWETLMMENSWLDSKMWTTTLDIQLRERFPQQKTYSDSQKNYIDFFYHQTGKVCEVFCVRQRDPWNRKISNCIPGLLCTPLPESMSEQMSPTRLWTSANRPPLAIWHQASVTSTWRSLYFTRCVSSNASIAQ